MTSIEVEANANADNGAKAAVTAVTSTAPVSDSADGNADEVVGDQTAAASRADNGKVDDGGKQEEEEKGQEPVDAQAETQTETEPQKGIKVLFLSSDTGGGHRASAESLARQFELLYPGSSTELLDLSADYPPPYNSIVSHYKHLSANPAQWNMLYKLTNAKSMGRIIDTNLRVMTMVCERSMRKKLSSYQADVIVSVHPLMTHVPSYACSKISHESGQHLPMFTVVTDLGSAHTTWFANTVEKMFVGSRQIYELAKERGHVPDEKLNLLGLPIRHDFALQSERLGDRMSPEGIAYQRKVRKDLKLPATDRKTLLVMGGGEGVGSLSNIVNALYAELVKQSIDAVILVVCGRNEKLKHSLETRDWAQIMEDSKQSDRGMPAKGSSYSTSSISRMFKLSSPVSTLSACSDTPTVMTGCIEGGIVTTSLRRILSNSSIISTNNENAVIVPSSPTEKMKTTVFTDALTSTEEKKNEEDGTTSLVSRDLITKDVALADQIAVDTDADVDADADAEEAAAAGKKQSQDASQASAVAASVDQDGKEQDGDDDGVADVASPGFVDVVGLGFVTNMAEYMVASDILISKAGPGTISEAAALSLPVMLTSFLPGQEEGNVDFVVDGGFGAFSPDSDPQAVGEEVAQWLSNPAEMEKLSKAAKAKGAPYAARDIVKQIGESTLAWKAINEAAKLESANDAASATTQTQTAATATT